jgi:hypothetical protein
MGALMGLGAALGGAGQEATQIGAQIRPILEQRRQGMAALFTHLADQSTDPDFKDANYQAAQDLMRGVDMGKVLPTWVKSAQTHQKNTAALGQTVAPMLGSPPPPPPQGPVGPGKAPGSPSTAPGAAAQPSANPIQGGSTIQGLPSGASALDLPAPPPPVASPAPSGPPAPIPPITPPDDEYPMTAYERDRMAKAQALSDRNYSLPPELEREIAPIAQRQAAFKEMTATSRFKLAQLDQLRDKSGNIPMTPETFYKAAALGIQMPYGMMGAMFNPIEENVNALGLESQHPGILQQFHIDPNQTPTVRILRNKFDPTGPPMMINGQTPGFENVTGPNGQITIAPKVAGQPQTPAGPAVSPNQANLSIKGIGPTGNEQVTSPADLRAGKPAIETPFIPPAMLGTARKESSQQTPEGGRVESSSTVKTLPGLPGAPAHSGTTPVPAAPGAPRVTAPLPVPAAIPPFNPANRTDKIAMDIANDAANWKEHTNAADKFAITSRMAQLGLDPTNLTGSMRDRAQNARLILGHLNDIQGIINQADKDGDLGVVATRWNDFLTNKLGKDPTKTQVFAKLSSELGFLSTAVSMAHGGLRGGSSPTMVEHWEKALDAKDPQTLRAKLGEAKKWMEGYSQLDRGLSRQNTPTILPAGPSVDDLVKKYGGK